MTSGSSGVDCLFCRLAAGEIPSERVYEDGYVLAFMDINPVRAGHTLIIPRKHYANVLELPAELGMPVMHATRVVGSAIMEGLGAEGFNVMQNNFPASGQVIFHVHWHLIPRLADDGLRHWPPSPYQDESAMADVAERIRKAIG